MVSSGTSWPRSAPSSASTSAAPRWPRRSCAGGCPRPERARAPRWRRRRSSTGSPRSPTPSSAEACLRGIEACIADLEHGSGGVEGIGVGVASMVDFAGGRVVESVNLPLADVPLRDHLQRRFGVPVVIDNDATAACIGEHVYGAGVGTRDMLMLTLGTGVGGGIISGGRPLRGASGAAAEIGHIIIDVNGPKCPANCPNHGCLEAYVAGPGHGRRGAGGGRARARARRSAGALAEGRTVDSRLLTQAGAGGRRRRDRRAGARRRVPRRRARHALQHLRPRAHRDRRRRRGGGRAAPRPRPPRPRRAAPCRRRATACASCRRRSAPTPASSAPRRWRSRSFSRPTAAALRRATAGARS